MPCIYLSFLCFLIVSKKNLQPRWNPKWKETWIKHETRCFFFFSSLLNFFKTPLPINTKFPMTLHLKVVTIYGTLKFFVFTLEGTYYFFLFYAFSYSFYIIFNFYLTVALAESPVEIFMQTLSNFQKISPPRLVLLHWIFVSSHSLNL